jgi:acid phosphatase
MRRLTLTALVTALVAAAAPAAASAATPAQSVGTAIPAPTVITTRIDGVPMYETYDGGGGLPYLGSASSYNAGDWEGTLRTYVSSGNYQTQISKVDSVADRWVTHRGWRGYHGKPARHARHARAAHHGRGHTKPAIVLDIDETSLSNYTAIDKDNFTYGPASQAEATEEIGKAIGPTLQVYKDALAHKVAVFFVTGRPEAQRAPTEDNLKREGYETWSKLYLKPAGTTLTTVAYKSGARKDIESQGYTIIANIGDQYSDLAGGHAQRAFKLANPFYFLP